MPLRRRVHHRRRKPSNLKKWKKRISRKKAGSYNQKQTLANAKAIKRLAGVSELKYQNNFVATTLNCFVGQVVHPTKVNNWGMPHSTQDWIAAGAAAITLAPELYSPFIIRPTCCLQGKTPQTPAPSTPATNLQLGTGENERVGNDITMSHLTVKGLITGGSSALNVGTYADAQILQKVHFVVVLDREPTDYARSTSGTFLPSNIPCQLYRPTSDNPLSSTMFSTGRHTAQALRAIAGTTNTGPYAGPKILTQQQADLEALSYYSKDGVMGETGRFKVLMKKSYSVNQVALNSNWAGQGAAPAYAKRQVVPFSFTLKAPYKFHFNSDSQILSSNQQLLVFVYSDTPVIRNSGGVAPANAIDCPRVSCYSRFSWKDS